MEERTSRSYTLRGTGVTIIKVQWPPSDEEPALTAVLSKGDLAVALSLLGAVVILLFALILMVVPV